MDLAYMQYNYTYNLTSPLIWQSQFLGMQAPRITKEMHAHLYAGLKDHSCMGYYAFGRAYIIAFMCFLLLALSRPDPRICGQYFSVTNGSMGSPFWSYEDNTDLHSI